MPVIVRLRTIALLGLAITVTGCAAPPAADVDAAKAAVNSAATGGADKYASDSLKAAQDAQAALDAELKAQDSKWVKSYDKAKELAAATKAAGDKAAADAVAGKEQADAVAAKEKAAAAARAKAKLTPPVRVGGQIRPPTKIRDVPPVPPLPIGVSPGRHHRTTIDPEGKVMDAKVVRSVPMLDRAALDAAHASGNTSRLSSTACRCQSW